MAQQAAAEMRAAAAAATGAAANKQRPAPSQMGGSPFHEQEAAAPLAAAAGSVAGDGPLAGLPGNPMCPPPSSLLNCADEHGWHPYALLNSNELMRNGAYGSRSHSYAAGQAYGSTAGGNPVVALHMSSNRLSSAAATAENRDSLVRSNALGCQASALQCLRLNDAMVTPWSRLVCVVGL